MGRDWKEGPERLIRLPNDDPETFRIYLHWLYRGTFPCRINEPALAGNAEFLQLAKAHVLGDKLFDGDFCNAAIDAIINKTETKLPDGLRWYPVGEVVQSIYDNTLPHSPTRRLLVDLYVRSGHKNWILEWAKPDDLPKQGLFDKSSNPITPSDCVYHSHGPGTKDCYKKGVTAEGRHDDKKTSDSTNGSHK